MTDSPPRERAQTGGAGARFALLTPPPAPLGGTPIAIVQVWADDAETLERSVGALGIRLPPPGGSRLADLAGVDRGIVARLMPTCAQLMPHGGRLIVDHLLHLLSEAGMAGVEAHDADPWSIYPEARSRVEAAMMETLARASSPGAIDPLLAQPELWEREAPALDERDARALRHLLHPPVIAGVGDVNVGKSTLLNALAGRGVAITSEAPGTTRDHVGVLLELDGLTARWLDTPGLRRADERDPIEREAVRIASDAIAEADAVVLCGDAHSGFPRLERLGVETDAPIIRCATRCDLSETPGEADVRTAALQGEGLTELGRVVREALVPRASVGRAFERRWVFHPSLGP